MIFSKRRGDYNFAKMVYVVSGSVFATLIAAKISKSQILIIITLKKFTIWNKKVIYIFKGENSKFF